MYHVKMFKCYLCMSVRYATAIEICLYVKILLDRYQLSF